jgi:NAD(P)-dependent dehydrogenase (short-subunit alcohol dehydrogenase family)
MTNQDLTGRVALVTGGAQRLGEGMARALAAAGAKVVVADLQDEAGQAVADSIGGVFVHVDVTDDASWEAGIAAAVEQAGGLDILVNNAGVEITSLLVDLDASQARTMLDVNVLGTALGLKHALRTMRPEGAAGKGGVVINIASVAATIAFPAIAVYSATKSAVERLTRVAAMESGALGYGVRVNCVYPGLVPNQMGANLAADVARIGLFGSTDEAVGAVVAQTPSGRLASTEDIAAAVVFLASDQAAFVNGAGLPVDGGMGM